MILRFIRYGTKLYAETPAGELAFGNAQGLYEWRDGQLIRYSGADRQVMAHGQWLQFMGNPEAVASGLRAAVLPHYRQTN